METQIKYRIADRTVIRNYQDHAQAEAYAAVLVASGISVLIRPRENQSGPGKLAFVPFF